ncbi:MAG: iron ABC transporter permease [Prochloraceae cyanobacterium]|nr:iron ABC transporter permease [Prochloraceae cyanobacterium]
MIAAKKTILTKSPSILWAGLFISLILLAICLIISTISGTAEISLSEVYTALTAFDGSSDLLIVRTVRIPRSLIAIMVGASLGVAGAIMQGLTKNPLASPSILGVNAGASFAVVIATLIFGNNSLYTYAWIAFVGAALSAIAVYSISYLSRGGVTPLNLTISGAALTAFISALTSGILILNQRSLDEIRFWLAGSVAGRELNLLIQTLPYLILGLILAFALSQQITLLSLGENVAKGLGQKTAQIKILAALSIILLAGGSVAIAGPIGFIGLIVPHIVRFFVGFDYRWILPYSAVFGAILLLVADILARIVVKPIELPVGLMMPLIGAPFFILLIKLKVKN